MVFLCGNINLADAAKEANLYERKPIKMKKYFFTIIAFLFIVISCSKKDSGVTAPPVPVPPGSGGTTLDCNTVATKAFAANVNPIIQSTCAIASCHATGNTNGPGPLTTYAQIFAARTAIRASVAAGTMPKSGTLSTAQKNSILCWVDSGAPNN